MKRWLAWLALLAGTSTAQTIVCPPDAPANIKLAAKELRRYVYLRTGNLLSIAGTGQGIALRVDPALDAQEYRISPSGITGGSDVGVLYGAYRYAERLGVRFQLHGDVVPDEPLKELPAVNDSGKPLFELRGLQPFHDFPEGPDWWTQDEWLSIVSQTVKMRMNFIGLHCYPFHNKDLGPEPLVWIGLPEDVNPDGTVKRADYSSWYTTAKFMPYGCYRPMKTGDYSFGAAEVFSSDDYGPEVNARDDFPMPKTPEASAALINRTGRMLSRIFTEARRRGVKIAVGTESPLDIPDGVKCDDLKRLYAGMFTRIQRAYPVDYYWIWGHEGEIDQQRFIANLKSAHAALAETRAPFGLGICGWGWITGNFPSLDRALPKEVVFSAINMSTGHAPVSPNFSGLEDRAKWAIPWLEDDGSLSSIQLRAGRVRRDAVDARRYGCTGLMGIFWRTRVLAPNLAALAQAGWEQGAWSQAPSPAGPKQDVEVLGGQTAAFLNNNVNGTDTVPVYQTLRYNLRGYRFTVPDGSYAVTLRFAEPAYKESGKRVFGVKLQGRQVAEHVDIFAKVGAYAALDMTFTNVAVTQGLLRVDFTPEVEFPSVCAIEVAGATCTRKINCGGPAYQDYAADPSPETLPRNLPVNDFYEDWARAEFGSEVAPMAAAIFTALDGDFPTPSGWLRGPGGIVTGKEPWTKASERFRFVDALADLRRNVKGRGNLERFDWWLNTFRATREMARLGALRGELDRLLAGNPERARKEALPVRLAMVRALGALHEALLATLHNSTELGTLCNIEQQSMLRMQILTGQDAKLEKLLGKPLPQEAHPWKEYRGVPRLVVMNARANLAKGESQALKIVALPAAEVTIHFRPLGGGAWQTLPARHVTRAVYEAQLPPAQDDFEYYVTGGDSLAWPAGAPQINQTVVVAE